MTMDTATNIIVQKTTDYEKFSFISGNRNISKANLKKLLNSMEEKQLIIPIIVNEKYQIIDGQHRFTGCKELKKPVYYIINQGYGIDEVKRANTVGTNWDKEDFLNTYIQEDNENYIMLNDLKKKYGLQIGVLLKIFASFQNKSDFLINSDFKKGNLEIKEEYHGVEFFCNQLEMFSNYKEYKANAFISAFLKLYFYEDYKPEIMIKQAERWAGTLDPKSKSQEALLEELCKTVYSYRLTKDQIFYSRQMKRFFK